MTYRIYQLYCKQREFGVWVRVGGGLVRKWVASQLLQGGARVGYLVADWVLTTNHRRLAILYFLFIVLTGLTGLTLATLIRVELAYPGQVFLAQNAERYLTTASLHGIVMVFFVVIPLLFGAFGNFLLPTQLGIRDVAFPRLNSFMYWVTPSGFILLLHIIWLDRAPQVVHWVNYSELRAQLRRRHTAPSLVGPEVHTAEPVATKLSLRLLTATPERELTWGPLSQAHIPQTSATVTGGAWSSMGDVHLRSPSLGGGLEGTSQLGGMGAAEGARVAGRQSQAVARQLGLLGDWRELKLEREVWRSLDTLALQATQLRARARYYTTYFENKAATLKVSSWLPNHLLPGWAFVTPYSSRLRYTAVGKVDVALLVVFMAGLGSVFSALNYVITYRYIGAPIFKNRRELRSFFVDALLVASRMMLLANPALLVAILLLLSDRHFNTSVFDFSGGGDTILFQHLFWFFGHPEVYIIVIPCFGFMNSLLPFFLRKRLSGRLSLQFSMYTIAFMGFAVWGHHMYMVGLANSVRTLYSTMTVMISVPASTKVLHWCVTLVQSTLVLDVGFLFLINFMYFFVLGGLSGMFVAHIGFDTIFHDTFYVIGHFHVMFAGAVMSASFAAFYFYFAALFGIRYNRFFAFLHYGCYTLGQIITLVPMFWLGFAGMPRRIMDYPSTFGGWHSLITGGHFITVFSLVCFVLMLLASFFENRAPASSFYGVSRLNTRLSFYTYELAKLRSCQTAGLVLNTRPQAARSRLAQLVWTNELATATYVFQVAPVR